MAGASQNHSKMGNSICIVGGLKVWSLYKHMPATTIVYVFFFNILCEEKQIAFHDSAFFLSLSRDIQLFGETSR